MKVLITGGFGKIGKYFVQNCSHEYKISVADIIIDNKTFTKNIEIGQM